MTELKSLGKTVAIPTDLSPEILEAVPNPAFGKLYVSRFTIPEFTSLCPHTGQPDFAHIVIDYIPDRYLVESKSLKLYMGSFRQHKAFHESCSMEIGQELVGLLAPIWLRVGAYWMPRGGIPIDVFYQTGNPPDGVWIPDQGVPAYRAR